MIPEKKMPAKIGIGIGVVLFLLGPVIYAALPKTYITWNVLVLLRYIGAIFFTWGCMNYAAGKGHSKWLGLVGLFSVFGIPYGLVTFFFLFCFNDRQANSK